jgi:2,3-bisphosphoglycerate-independent phosphoglycerate mutase
MKPIILAILDGVGMRDEIKGNAFKQAYTPIFNQLLNNYPYSLLDASEEAVGLPKGQMGNSEVGHLNIGAGRVVLQPLQLINETFNNESIFNNEKILKVINHVKNNNSKLHILGLLSDGGVHSHLNHILGMLELCKRNNITNVYFHVITDGRDTLPDCAYDYIKQLENKIKEYGFGHIATITGRYYVMDRDKRWDRTKLAYDALVNSEGQKYDNLKAVIDDHYDKKIYDEFILPSILNEDGKISNNDGIIFANFRPDRATQILTALTNTTFKDFAIKTIENLKLVSLMPCAQSVIGESAFEIKELKNTLGEYLADLSYSQLRIAETEKYAHVTYFFDGGKERILDGCDRLLINSPKVRTYDLKPEMSAYEITDKLLKAIDTNKYDVIILNYANCDMVGHTGDFAAAKKAVEVVDENLGRLYNKIKEKQGLLIVTADHGNCEYMLDENKHVVTSHTTNKVPFIICNKDYQVKDGKLADIAPTILTIMKIEIPKEMTGDILVV